MCIEFESVNWQNAHDIHQAYNLDFLNFGCRLPDELSATARPLGWSLNW